jgi:hypothetical protein
VLSQHSIIVTAAIISACRPSESIRRTPPRPRAFNFARTLATVFLTSGLFCFAQNDIENPHPAALVPPQPGSTQSQAEAPSFTFKVITRMVIVEVVVRDREDNPVRDLNAKDLRVFETIGDSKELPEKIASFRPITGAVTQDADRSRGIVLGWLHKSYCAVTGAYELSYYLSPETRKDGLHRISVSTTRDDLTLYFRPGYKIEADKTAEVGGGELPTPQTNAQLQQRQAMEAARKKHPELELPLIACYDNLHTTSFQLGLQKLPSKQGETYEFVVPASYFASSPPADSTRPTELDYSLCTFEYDGHPLSHFDGIVPVGKTPEDYQLISTRGFAQTITFEPQQPGTHALSARLVVRDRSTGALGAGEILLLSLGPDHFPAPIPEGKTNSLFGTPGRDTPLALCGDVYELAPWTTRLPRFSEIDALAPIYATSLGVYSRFFTLGIPGVTSRTEWFGVNYWGVFGVDRPGKYEFDLLSDDGAKVYIDEQLIVSDDTLHSAQGSRGTLQLTAGAHDIRISYFQGPRTEVALVLLVKPPKRSWRLFDMRDFPNPEDSPAQRKKLPLPEQ